MATFFILFVGLHYGFVLLNVLKVSGYPIGVNYGTVANNLPPPSDVAAFLRTNTRIDRVKLFDASPEILQAFSETKIAVTVTVGNGDVVSLADSNAATSWVAQRIVPFHRKTWINRIAVGNEILATSDRTLIAKLLPAMKSIKSALEFAGIHDIEVTSPHSLGILSASDPPSTGKFRNGYDRVFFPPLLDFHRRTGASFMVNPYPYFGFTERTLTYALFEPNSGVRDNFTGITYTNMFDAQLDAVFSALNKIGYGDVNITVGETGWPSFGVSNQAGVSLENAAAFNGNLVKHLSSGTGTPLMPNRIIETFIFSLFNENLKPSVSEQNFGLFRPDFSQVYESGLLKNPTVVRPPARGTWCVAKDSADPTTLQNNIDYACGKINCAAIQRGGSCYSPDDVRSHASYAMNTYFRQNGGTDADCSFAGSGMRTSLDPSTVTCKFL